MRQWNEDDEFEATQSSRFGFRGRAASPEVTQLYLGKKIPDDLRKKGAISPVKYSPNFDGVVAQIRELSRSLVI